MPQKQFLMLFWFCVCLILFAMIHTMLFFFVRVPKENLALVQGNNTFWLGSAATLAIGFMIGSSSNKRQNLESGTKIDADITVNENKDSNANGQTDNTTTAKQPEQ